ncbi:MAG: hypothetical protein OHK93_002458 [Ramalina farinacea]|uniref:NAD(P)-binding protein n=1 Tax=Ramalina farinacea TaxID=258253 RepID=A0AA43TYS2_9LECA|nr:hypothetical protein [Ramalina farinacea]
MGVIWSQMRPPAPQFTEQDMPSLDGKVIIVTGGNAGVGFELVKMLYPKGGCTIYIASRSSDRIAAAIEEIKSTVPAPPAGNPTRLKSLRLDLNDLTTISETAKEFLAQESRLDILWNNAGIAQAPIGSTTKQGYEAHMGVNCLGPYLFTKLLTPLLVKTAHSGPANSVRVIWTSSQIIETNGPAGGISFEEQQPGKHPADKNHTYAASKAGNWFLASELDKRVRDEGVVSITQNPGNLITKSWDPVAGWAKFLLWPFLFEPRMGGYTMLWAGLSPQITCKDGGRYGIPWGRWHPPPKRELLGGGRGKELLESKWTKEEGGTGLAAEFWGWCDEQTGQYA